MRVLVSTTAGSGHLGPVLPFARACGAAGHDAVVAAPASFAAEGAAVGAGLHLDGGPGGVDAVPDAVARVVAGTAYRRRPARSRTRSRSCRRWTTPSRSSKARSGVTWAQQTISAERSARVRS